MELDQQLLSQGGFAAIAMALVWKIGTSLAAAIGKLTEKTTEQTTVLLRVEGKLDTLNALLTGTPPMGVPVRRPTPPPLSVVGSIPRGNTNGEGDQ